MEVHQLFDPKSSSYSYLLWDGATREAALIDPVQDQVSRDIRLIRELDLKLLYTLETHIHADHITGSGLLRKTLNSIVLVHEDCGSKCADILLRDGDQIPLGSAKIRILHTPGHTRGDVCYLIPGVVFSGDTLLIRGCGRTDFQSGDPGILYDSITRRLFTLPDDTIVYPGHDYSGRSYTTIGEEKAHNPRAGNGKSRDDFIAIMNGLRLDPPQHMHEALPSNLRCGSTDYGPKRLSP
jgi:glyoxylase-like metal-dependent hydrolase (beta-lactamase superfamily II)